MGHPYYSEYIYFVVLHVIITDSENRWRTISDSDNRCASLGPQSTEWLGALKLWGEV